MKRRLRYFIYLITVAVFSGSCSEKSSDPLSPTSPFDLEYNIVIDPSDFETDFEGNNYFILKPGTTFIYEGKDEDGVAVRVEEEILTQVKVIMGVTCRIVNAREYEDDNGSWDLVEDTFDWYAQDNDGNVWYFGEDSREIEDGAVVSTAGSWEAGQDGALPGIIMLDRPYPGLSYRQEYYEDEAEDVADILSLNASVNTPYDNYSDCLQIAEWNLLEPGIIEHKFYKEGVGLVYVEAVKGEEGFEALKEIINP